MQTRIYDFGALLTQDKTKRFASNLFTPGIYQGMEASASTGTELSLTAGTVLLPSGILVNESTPVTISVPTPGSATDYTVVFSHGTTSSIGGTPATLSLETGILPRSGSPDTSSLAVAWIRHPGSTALTDDMITQPPTLQAGTLLEAIEDGYIAAPFPGVSEEAKGANIQVTTGSYIEFDGPTACILSAVVGGNRSVSNLVAMDPSYVGRYLKVESASDPLLNGFYRIVAYGSPTGVTVEDNGNGGGAGIGQWNIVEPGFIGTLVRNSASSGLQRYQFLLPIPPRPVPRRIKVFGDLPALATIGMSRFPYTIFDGSGGTVGSTPATVSGPVTGLDPSGTPIAEFVLDNYPSTNPPVAIGFTIDVPPSSSFAVGVFLRGIEIEGD